MRVLINGACCETRARTVGELLRERGGDAGRVAVVLNDEILPAGTRAAVLLHADDRIELLAFAAGG